MPHYGIKASTLKGKYGEPLCINKKSGNLRCQRSQNMSSNGKNDTPILIRKYAGITVFFNPGWIVEIKIITRPIMVLRHKKLRTYQQRLLIIHNLVGIFGIYRIPLRWVKHYNLDPLSYAITFKMYAAWHANTASNCAGHIIECFRKNSLQGRKIKDVFEFSYHDVERVEHQDGTILWQKQR